MGEEGLFEMMIRDNTELLNNYAAKRLVALSPRCYSRLRINVPISRRSLFTILTCLKSSGAGK